MRSNLLLGFDINVLVSHASINLVPVRVSRSLFKVPVVILSAGISVISEALPRNAVAFIVPFTSTLYVA